MSTQTVTKKRKSTGDTATATKKVKTTKSVEKSAPLKSALKKRKETMTEKPVKPAKAKKSKAVEKVVEDDVEDEAAVEATAGAVDAAEGGVQLTEDQTAALIAGFSSSEDEASDDEGGISIEKLPNAPRMKEVQKRINDATAKDPETTPGVIYIGRLPHGFFEPQMRAYFSQFGEILHLRMARNKKTSKSQHHAFVEFASKAVAEIVAKTMDKYLLFGHIMQVRTVPSEQIKENIWKGAGKRKPVPRNRLEGAKLKKGMVREDWEKRVGKEEKKRAEKAQKLKEMGYEFEMPAVKAVGDVPVKPKAIEQAPTVETEDDGAKLIEAQAEPVMEIGAGEEEADARTASEKTIKKRLAKEVKAKKAKKVKT